jgi:hypothetical protein
VSFNPTLPETLRYRSGKAITFGTLAFTIVQASAAEGPFVARPRARARAHTSGIGFAP